MKRKRNKSKSLGKSNPRRTTQEEITTASGPSEPLWKPRGKGVFILSEGCPGDNMRKRYRCIGCGCREGELHRDPLCPEICPFCHNTWSGCTCEPKDFGLKVDMKNEKAVGRWIDTLEAIRKKAGRIPFVLNPNLCARCGETWPAMFHATDWDAVIPHPLKNELLCLDCYELIRKWTLQSRGRSVKPLKRIDVIAQRSEAARWREYPEG